MARTIVRLTMGIKMIATLVLSYPKATRRIGAVIAVVFVAAMLYWMGVGGNWITTLFPSLAPGIAASPEITRALAAICFALLIAVN